jgi:hypothetical protein
VIFFVLDGVDAMLHKGVIEPAYRALSDFVARPLRSGVILLVAAHGFNLMKGHTQNLSMVDVGWLILKIAFVSELLINWSTFNDLAYSTIWGTYTEIANGLAGLMIPNRDALLAKLGLEGVGFTLLSVNGSVLDEAFEAQLASAFTQTLSVPEFVDTNVRLPLEIPGFGDLFGGVTIPIPVYVPNVIENIAGVIKFVMTIVLFASVFVVMLLSRIGLTSCLAVAPIFIALALFQHTRSYTDSWFRGMLGFILTPLLLVLVLVVADASIAVLSGSPPSGSGVLGFIAPAIAYLILYYALAKSVASVPQFASGMVGSMLSHIGDGAAHQLIGGMHKGIDAGIGAAKGAVKGFATGGPAGAKAGAVNGAASAMR